MSDHYDWLPTGPGAAQRPQHRLWRVVLLIVALLGGGTLGYWWIEGDWPLFDALYMTVITVGTVGYGETHELSQPGRAFTIVLILASLVVIAYAGSALAAFIFEGHFERILHGRRMDSRIAGLKDHVILCGARHTGVHVAQELFKTGTPFVVVDTDADALAAMADVGDIPLLLADPTRDDTLQRCGITRAKGLAAVLQEDKDNVFVTLSARSLNPHLRIVSRLVDEENRAKLLKAGADEIVATEAIGGMRIASVMIRPGVVTFLDKMLRKTDATLRFEEVPADDAPGLVGQTLGDSQLAKRTGALIVAIRGRDGGYRFNPGADYRVQSGDVLIAIGTLEQITLARKSTVDPGRA